MHASTVAIALLAASQAALAAPMPASNTNFENNARSISAIGDAISGFAEDVLGPHIGKREVDERSLTAIGNFISGIFNKRGEPLDERSLTAIGNFISGIFNKREEPLDARSISAIGDAIGNFAEDVLGPHFGKRSLKAVGAAVAGGVASGVAGAVASNVFGRAEASDLMVDTETGTIYMDIPDSNEGRSLSAIENFFSNLKREEPEARSLSAIENFFSNLKRDTSSGIMVDTETGTLYMDVPDANEGRSLKAVGTAVAGGIASGVAGAVAKDIFNKRAVPSGLMVDTETGTLYMDVPDANEGRSLKAVGTAVAGGIASGVAGAVAKDIFNKRSEPSGVLVDTDSGVIFMDVPDANADRSLKAVGTAIAGGIASGVAGAAVKSALDNRSLSAIENFFSNLKRDEEARSLSAIENFFSNLKRDDDIDARSISAIKNFLGNLKRSELEESMAKRAINDLE